MQAREAALDIAVIEDQDRIRVGLRLLIEKSTGWRCVCVCSSIEEALTRFARAVPQVALVDIGLPGMSGIEGTRVLKERYPGLQIIILTVYDDDAQIFQALCAGATGYLLKNTPRDRLIES